MNDLDLCIDVFPPGEIYERPALPEPADLRVIRGPELAMAFDRWETGQEIRIHFMDGSARLHERVEMCAREWLRHANLRFTFGRFASSEVRITFKGTGAWSYVGTAALRISRDKPTMQLGGLTEDTGQEDLRRKVLHEFGHMLGCIHEQASPAADIPWDEEAVYKFYLEYSGWRKEEVKRNVLQRYSANDVVFSGYDPTSIMQYPVSKEHTGGKLEIGWNTVLSEMDKDFISRMYPQL